MPLISVLAFIALCFSSLTAPQSTWAQEALDNPLPHTVQNGIGLINGWVCEAQEILIQVDEAPPVQAAYGTTRGDTIAVCGDDDNGFGLTVNWNLLGDGIHRLRVIVDGAERIRVAFVVANLGLGEFPQNLVGEGTVIDFPTTGENTAVIWQQSLQNFVLQGTGGSAGGGLGGSPPRVLDTPQPGSLQSGVGLISGWVCEADIVSILIDDQPAIPAAYGTTRGDTVGFCGDDNNGFGLTFNWNAVGDGEHRLRALADGEQFADVTFTVNTLGLGEFPTLQGIPSSVGSVVNFLPQSNLPVVLQWQDSKQNFVVKGTIPPGRDEAMCCLPQMGQATDPNGIFANLLLSNICSVSGETARIDVETPVQSSQQGAKAGGAFEFCAADLNFEQAEMELLLGDFQVFDEQGNEVACQEVGPGERRIFTIGVEENAPFSFREPTRVLFNETEVIEVDMVCGDGQFTPSEECEGGNLRGATCQSLGFASGTLSCTDSCRLDTSACVNLPQLPELMVSPRSLNFGNIPINGSATQPFTITNIGGGTLTGTWGFSGITCAACPFSFPDLGPGQSATPTAQINAGTQLGSFSASIVVNTNAGSQTISITWNVVDLNPPQLSVSPRSLNFGNIPINGSATQPFTITNIGGGTLTGTWGFSGITCAACPFSFPDLGPGQSVMPTAQINAGTQLGSFSASIVVNTNAGSQTISITWNVVDPII